jgi:hypothetical protein
MKTTPFVVAALAAFLIAPACALAVTPDHTGDLSASKASFEWDSKLGTGFTSVSNEHSGPVGCGTAVVHDCDETLLHVTGCGTVDVANKQTVPTAVDTDLYTYYSDAAGDKVDAGPSSAQGSPTPNEAVSLGTESPDGYILAEIDYTDYIGTGVHGTATFTPYAPGTFDPDTCQLLDDGS